MVEGTIFLDEDDDVLDVSQFGANGWEACSLILSASLLFPSTVLPRTQTAHDKDTKRAAREPQPVALVVKQPLALVVGQFELQALVIMPETASVKIKSRGAKLDFTQTAAAVVSQIIGEAYSTISRCPIRTQGKDAKAVERGRQAG